MINIKNSENESKLSKKSIQQLKRENTCEFLEFCNKRFHEVNSEKIEKDWCRDLSTIDSEDGHCIVREEILDRAYNSIHQDCSIRAYYTSEIEKMLAKQFDWFIGEWELDAFTVESLKGFHSQLQEKQEMEFEFVVNEPAFAYGHSPDCALNNFNSKNHKEEQCKPVWTGHYKIGEKEYKITPINI